MLKQVITFFGGDAKVGTTMIAQSVAEEIAAKKNKVLLIFASQELFDEFISTEDNHTSIDDIQRIDPAKLTLMDVEHIIQTAGSIDYIKGCVRPTEIRLYHENILKSIISLVTKKYDYIVIDGGHNYHYPLPVYSLLAATSRVYVTTQDYKSVARFYNTMKTILKQEAFKTLADEMIVINKYHKNDGVYTEDHIKQIFTLNTLTIPRAKISSMCEVNHHTLSKLDRSFRQAVTDLAIKLMSEV